MRAGLVLPWQQPGGWRGNPLPTHHQIKTRRGVRRCRLGGGSGSDAHDHGGGPGGTTLGLLSEGKGFRPASGPAPLRQPSPTALRVVPWGLGGSRVLPAAGGVGAGLGGSQGRGGCPRCPALAWVELGQDALGDALQQLPGEDAQQLPAQVQRLEDGPVLVGTWVRTGRTLSQSAGGTELGAVVGTSRLCWIQ